MDMLTKNDDVSGAVIEVYTVTDPLEVRALEWFVIPLEFKAGDVIHSKDCLDTDEWCKLCRALSVPDTADYMKFGMGKKTGVYYAQMVWL